MVTSTLPAFVVALAFCSVALLAPSAEAHGCVLYPQPVWNTKSKDDMRKPLAFLETQGFKTGNDVGPFLAENNYTSLRDFLDNAKYTVADGADFHSGYTNANGSPQPIPENSVIRVTGYTHNGPCMVCFHNKVVLEGKNCHEEFPNQSHLIDYSSCIEKSCKLYWYWLAIRYLKNTYSWQVYKAIIPLKGGKGAKAPTPNNLTTDNKTAKNDSTEKK